MNTDVETLTHAMKAAIDIQNRAIEIIAQVENGEKNPVVLKTAREHLESAGRLLSKNISDVEDSDEPRFG